MRVKASSGEIYVPDVFYKYKNEYGIDVVGFAKPTFPVEYLLTTSSHGFPTNPDPLLNPNAKFPIENRTGELQGIFLVEPRYKCFEAGICGRSNVIDPF